jgi:hypothetical protein
MHEIRVNFFQLLLCSKKNWLFVFDFAFASVLLTVSGWGMRPTVIPLANFVSIFPNLRQTKRSQTKEKKMAEQN